MICVQGMCRASLEAARKTDAAQDDKIPAGMTLRQGKHVCTMAPDKAREKQGCQGTPGL